MRSDSAGKAPTQTRSARMIVFTATIVGQALRLPNHLEGHALSCPSYLAAGSAAPPFIGFASNQLFFAASRRCLTRSCALLISLYCRETMSRNGDVRPSCIASSNLRSEEHTSELQSHHDIV